jgi:hypothetical protein
MRAIRFVVNWLMIVAMPLWVLPIVIMIVVSDPRYRAETTGRKWLWEP